ncbi:ABC transporter permease [Tessaracoccus antarcticus]|uniref:ABC transporter permease n=1 Tax=Tessaracoccus antarcticus TaxID=2479848 RepID=A0A3M0G4E7_9ACTN|nr:ABC transporter permease [Tessaracoccus antarcticus]RMB59725.1 ABC transporter permease [Tessaracoccus antarcticus]
MTALDFTPAAGAAPRSRQVWAHATTEASLILRNGEQALLALVIPIGILVAGRFLGSRFGLDFPTLAPSVLALAIWSSCFTSLAISTGFERRYNVLERLAATPLGKSGILLGKATAIALVTGVQLVVLLGVALVLGWRPGLDPVALVIAVVACLLAAGAFAGLALCLAGTARPEITLAVANLVYLIGLVGGGILLPVASHPAWARPIISLLPTAALGEALRNGTAMTLVVLAVWCAGTLVVARKVFRWTS